MERELRDLKGLKTDGELATFLSDSWRPYGQSRALCSILYSQRQGKWDNRHPIRCHHRQERDAEEHCCRGEGRIHEEFSEALQGDDTVWSVHRRTVTDISSLQSGQLDMRHGSKNPWQKDTRSKCGDWNEILKSQAKTTPTFTENKDFSWIVMFYV